MISSLKTEQLSDDVTMIGLDFGSTTSSAMIALARVGQTMLVHFGRVRLAECIGDKLMCNLVILLAGERPGGDALSSKSMSAYLALKLKIGRAHV